jgi:hypothetical protein
MYAYSEYYILILAKTMLTVITGKSGVRVRRQCSGGRRGGGYMMMVHSVLRPLL